MTIVKYLFYIVIAIGLSFVYGQAPLYSNVLISNTTSVSNIGNANSSRNVTIDANGNIYVVYTNDLGIYVTKSIDRGQSFLPSVLVASIVGSEPEIIVNDNGVVLVSWSQSDMDSDSIMLSRSLDGGNSFTLPVKLGIGFFSVHMAVFGSNVYIIDKIGENFYANGNNGEGIFSHTQLPSRVFADVWVDANGTVYIPSDDPKIVLIKSDDYGTSFVSIPVTPTRDVFFSSYALNDGPCGTYIFIGGFGNNGFKIDLSNGVNNTLVYGGNFNFQGRTLFADNRGTLIDGYQNNIGELIMQVSNDQGQSFGSPIVIAQGGSHNIARNPVTEDVVVVYEQNGQIYVSVYADLLKTIKIDLPSNTAICYGKTLSIPYSITGGFDADTILDLYISDDTGSFENITLIGSVMSNTSGSLDIQLPDTILPGDQYRIQIESVADCTQSNIIDLEIYEEPDAIILSVGSPICEGEDAVFQIMGTPNTEVYYILNGVTNNLVVLDTNGNGTITAPNVSINQTLNLERVVDISTGCDKSLNDTATIIVNPLPAVNLEDNYLLCVDTNGSETVLTPPIIDTFLDPLVYDFAWFVNGTIETSFNGLSAIMPYQGGSYEVEVSYFSTGCGVISNTAQVNESSPPLIFPKVITPAFANNHVIEVEARNSTTFNGISEYEFRLNNGDWVMGSGDPGGNYTYTFDQEVRLGVNTIYVRDVVGCGVNQVEVVVMDYPLYFTPNGDRFHDTWNIAAPESPVNYLASAEILIFDRYGKLLKQLDPLGPGWNGMFNGSVMPTDDYWFVVNFVDPLDNRQRQFRAHFALRR